MFGRFKGKFSLKSGATGGAATRWLLPESRFIVTVDEHGVVCRRPSGEEQSVRWDELEVVMVETNDTGPLGSDVWWLLLGRSKSGGCVVPQGATGEDSLFRALQALPGFENDQAIAAMSCTENRSFLCWRRTSAS